MKVSWVAVAAVFGSALASDGHGHGHKHSHPALLTTGGNTCGCTTSVVTYWGSPTRE